MSKEFKVGIFICSLFVVWALTWGCLNLVYTSDFFSQPQFNIKLELLRPMVEYKIEGDSFLFTLGTDLYGRSLFELISNGVLYSIVTALIVSFFSAFIGLLIGYFSVVSGSWMSAIFNQMINIIFILPGILIAILILSLFGGGYFSLVFALIFVNWPSYAKIARGECIRIFSLPLAESAMAIGVDRVRFFRTIVIPNLIPVLLVHFILGLSGIIISEASLSFLGLGSSEYSWGQLLSMGKTVLLEAPYIVAILSVILSLLIIGMNLIGDGLRDLLDPKTK